MPIQKQKIIVILGPTASGKSDLAVELAKKFNGEIISADSRQVYKDMDIGTGKITKKEMRGVPHHLLDVVSPKTKFDVARYQKLAHKKIADILKRGKLPIVCGGTGLYIKAIIENPMYPDIPPDWKLRKKLEKLSVEKLFSILKKLDPKRARTIDKKNPRRLIRAIEIAKQASKVPAIKSYPLYDALLIGIKKSPDELKKAITVRLHKRIKQGMISEVKKLRAQGVSWKRLEELGLEYKYIALYLQGKIDKQTMSETLEIRINQYARRQMTWFKKTPDVYWTKNEKETEKLLNQFLRQ
ncbi:MAG: tRNA (adenosine(37)-N6)-dimethylallyltransferase MiaA [Patescibacteria group bacterium]